MGLGGLFHGLGPVSGSGVRVLVHLVKRYVIGVDVRIKSGGGPRVRVRVRSFRFRSRDEFGSLSGFRGSSSTCVSGDLCPGIAAEDSGLGPGSGTGVGQGPGVNLGAQVWRDWVRYWV